MCVHVLPPPPQVHGFPKVMGVLTHLDGFQDASRLKKTKKKLKQRFWTEIYDGAKLFYLSGLQYGEAGGPSEGRSGSCSKRPAAPPPSKPSSPSAGQVAFIRWNAVHKT